VCGEREREREREIDRAPREREERERERELWNPESYATLVGASENGGGHQHTQHNTHNMIAQDMSFVSNVDTFLPHMNGVNFFSKKPTKKTQNKKLGDKLFCSGFWAPLSAVEGLSVDGHEVAGHSAIADMCCTPDLHPHTSTHTPHTHTQYAGE